MRTATRSDKSLVVQILTKSFFDNKSVSYLIPQGRTREVRVQTLMKYSFEVCMRFGKVYISEDRTACALILFPDKRRNTLTSLYLDLKLIITCIGLRNVRKAVSRDVKIRQKQIKVKGYYLWFIGVNPDAQNNGVGSVLLSDLIYDAQRRDRTIYLETSTVKNIPWYKKFGFIVYGELNLGYKLFFLKN